MDNEIASRERVKPIVCVHILNIETTEMGSRIDGLEENG